MIVKISRGARLGGLMRYLVGEGKRNEHTRPHLVAGSPEVLSWYSHETLSQSDAAAIARVTDRPRMQHRTSVTVRATEADVRRGVRPGGVLVDEGRKHAHVWHCSLSLPPSAARLAERQGAGRGRQVLEDATWERVASEFVDELGFTGSGGKSPCRWVAVHHGFTENGGDHIHIAVVLVREDGTRASTHNDYRKASAAAARLETKYGLEEVAGRRVGRSAPGRDLGEVIAAARASGETGVPVEPYSQRLGRKVRAAAAVAETEAAFVRGCREGGLVLRPRFAAGSVSEVTGFAVAEATGAGTGPLVWRAAGKLGRDLTLPRLRDGFSEDASSREGAVGEWQRARGLADVSAVAAGTEVATVSAGAAVMAPAVAWRDRALQVAQLREQLRGVPVEDHAMWAAVSHEVAGVLAAWSVATEAHPGHLAQAADSMGRAAAVHRRAAAPRAQLRVVSLRGPALLVASLAAGAGSRTGQALLLRELLNTMRAINLTMAATRQARAAAQVEETARARLMKVQGALPSPPALSGALDENLLVTLDRRARTAAPAQIPGAMRAPTKLPARGRPRPGHDHGRDGKDGGGLER